MKQLLVGCQKSQLQIKTSYIVTSWNTSTCHQDCSTWKDLPMKNVLHSFQSEELHYYTRLGRNFCSDLSWWHVFLDNWNGLSLLRYIKGSSSHHYSIQTDASGSWGCRAYLQGQWLHGNGPPSGFF